MAVAVLCHSRLVTTTTSRCTATARTLCPYRRAASGRLEQLRRFAEGLDLLGRLLLPGLELLALPVHPDHRHLHLQAGLHVGLVSGPDVHPARLAAYPPRALLEVGRVRLVAAHLLRRDHEVE